MLYDRELQFLRATLKKNHINSHIVSSDTPVFSILDYTFSVMLSAETTSKTFRELVGDVSERTLYRHTDPIGLCFSYLALPPSEGEKKEILLIGPYFLSEPMSSAVSQICDRLGIQKEHRKYFEEFYFSLNVLSESSPLFTMLDSFCEIIWKTSDYAVVDMSSDTLSPASPINNTEQNDILVSMKSMEKRYAMENELMEAVTLGKLHRLKSILSLFSEQSFERRSSDHLRDMKNYGVITNTLLRKAAEQGGVHPMYLDKVSSSFAVKIEQMTSPSSIKDMIGEMFVTYCRLVKKHSLKNYSPIVQKAIVTIDADLSADLSLSTLAESQNVSAGYLCTVFKKETGKTPIEYIREKRINHACHLLATTHLQVQTIALNCGIVDVQYFSKTFKKMIGKTPKEFREHVKNNAF